MIVKIMKTPFARMKDRRLGFVTITGWRDPT
jgi:hypothetical protein